MAFCVRAFALYTDPVGGSFHHNHSLVHTPACRQLHHMFFKIPLLSMSVCVCVCVVGGRRVLVAFVSSSAINNATIPHICQVL